MIEVSDVSKTFKVRAARRGRELRRARRTVHAVRHVSFAIDAGEFVGYLGPNGAGNPVTGL